MGLLVVLLSTLFLAGVASAAGSAPPDGDAPGRVVGRVVQEPRRPSSPPTPTPDVDIILLPHSHALLDRLEEIKRRSRRDVRSLRVSGRDIQHTVRVEETAGQAVESGGASRRERTGADGAFAISPVPAGAWVLVALRSTFTPKKPESLKARDRNLHQLEPRLTGYRTVEVWVRAVEVGAGQETELELTDRNVWMTAIEEERTPEPAR